MVEGYFSTETPSDQKGSTVITRLCSQKKTKVLITAESELVESPKRGAKPRRAGYLKMRVIEDLSKETINNAVQELASDAHA